MSRYFVDAAPIAVPEWDEDPSIISDRPPNVIWIKSKMDVATKGKVTSEMFTLGKDSQLEARLGSQELALLIHNIVKWEGPDFDRVPATRENIMRLDPTEPHIAKVLEVIAERNKSPKAPKGSAIDSTSTNNGAIDSITSEPSISMQLASTPTKSPLRPALDGRRARSAR